MKDCLIPPVVDSQVFKLQIPLGRLIGDNGCAYDTMDVVALRLTDADGRTGWGYTCATPVGYFKRTGWWIRSTPSESQLASEFKAQVLPLLSAEQALKQAIAQVTGSSAFLEMAARMALWDLAAKSAGLNVSRLLSNLFRTAPRGEVRCYGSTLDFPIPEKTAQELAADYASMGIIQIKVKVGADSPARDIRRLQAIREAAGEGTRLTADANEVWDVETTLQRLRAYEDAGIHLVYIEDPLPRNAWDGYAELVGRSPVPVAGHDYFTEVDQYERAAQNRLFDFFRSGQDTLIQTRVSDLAGLHGLPVYYGNSIMEQNIQAASALEHTVMIEYSGLDWWLITGSRPEVADGYMLVPEGLGFGLDPDPDALREFAYPEVSEMRMLPCPFQE